MWHVREVDTILQLNGHLVGSIGEVLVAEAYGLTLMENSSPVHDAISPNGRKVQIKATQGNRISISSEPEYLIAIHKDENFIHPGELTKKNRHLRDQSLPG